MWFFRFSFQGSWPFYLWQSHNYTIYHYLEFLTFLFYFGETLEAKNLESISFSLAFLPSFLYKTIYLEKWAHVGMWIFHLNMNPFLTSYFILFSTWLVRSSPRIKEVSTTNFVSTISLFSEIEISVFTITGSHIASYFSCIIFWNI